MYAYGERIVEADLACSLGRQVYIAPSAPQQFVAQQPSPGGGKNRPEGG